MTETLAHGYLSESTWRELSNEYQHDWVQMFFKNLCVLVLWTKEASALEGLKNLCTGLFSVSHHYIEGGYYLCSFIIF